MLLLEIRTHIIDQSFYLFMIYCRKRSCVRLPLFWFIRKHLFYTIFDFIVNIHHNWLFPLLKLVFLRRKLNLLLTNILSETLTYNVSLLRKRLSCTFTRTCIGIKSNYLKAMTLTFVFALTYVLQNAIFLLINLYLSLA